MTTAPFGTWPSPLSPAVMGGARVSLTGLQVVGDTCWWSESRPHDGGRMAVMRLRRGGTPEEVSPATASVRCRIHEYGGGAHWTEGDDLFFTDLAEQALWWQGPEAEPVRLTEPAPDGETHRYGDARPVTGDRFLVCLRERHHAGGPAAGDTAAGDTTAGDTVVDDEVVAVDRTGVVPPTVLVAGRDFFAAPRPSPDGRWLAWLTWDHPNMPWDGTELWVAEWEAPDTGAPRLRHPVLVAGGPDESVGQPRWAGAELVFVSDRFGWWQPFSWTRGGVPRRRTDLEAEFAAADWNLDQRSVAVDGQGRLLCRVRRAGADVLAVVDGPEGDGDGGPDGESPAIEEIPQPCVTIGAVAWGEGGEMYLIGSGVATPPALYRITTAGAGTPGGAPVVEEIYRPVSSPLEPDWVSVPEQMSFATEEAVATLLFFAPHGPGWRAPDGELPPLVVHCHGGPTAGVDPGFDPAVQLWTTRGVAVALVDYRGSTGHGRRFRHLLDGAWGEADAEDCRAAARFLADSGLVDGDRIVARGQSAGGLTALRCLDAGGPFAAAVVAYGVTDLSALAADTHKFEARYNDRLVGPWPQAAAVYEERSPACHPERVDGAVLLLQGAEDLIVPPDQADRMVGALRARGVRCDHVVFAGEGHGFRRADTLTRSAELEIAFVRDVLGIGAGGDGPT